MKMHGVEDNGKYVSTLLSLVHIPCARIWEGLPVEKYGLLLRGDTVAGHVALRKIWMDLRKEFGAHSLQATNQVQQEHSLDQILKIDKPFGIGPWSAALCAPASEHPPWLGIKNLGAQLLSLLPDLRIGVFECTG